MYGEGIAISNIYHDDYYDELNYLKSTFYSLDIIIYSKVCKV